MFTSVLRIDAYVVDDEFVVVQDLVWEAAEKIVVPQGFITDFASIPWFLRGVLDINGKSRRAAVLHDWLYCSKTRERAECDALFKKALAACGVGSVEQAVYYAGVRAGGWLAWSKHNGLDAGDFVPQSYWTVNPVQLTAK